MANNQVEQIHERLTRHIETLVTGDDWRVMLAVASRFHNYSMRNIMLIEMQNPEATRVAGYRVWQSLGRQVRKGEKGIKILAPCTYKRDDNTNGDDTRVLRGFRLATVFDIAQTDGDEIADVRPTLLRGDGPVGLWAALEAQVLDHGFRIERGDTRPANGVTDFVSNVVTIGDTLEPAQAVKTLAHELGHIACGHRDRLGEDRDVLEVEAESVAYIVCATAGLASDTYTFPYVARWAGGDLATITATGTRVVETASTIIDTMNTKRPALTAG